MASRVHWVFMSMPGSPRFDHAARAYFEDSIRRMALDSLGELASARVIRQMEQLPISFRKALPILQEIAIECGWPISKKLRKFRLTKKTRRNKNPIYSWRQAA